MERARRPPRPNPRQEGLACAGTQSTVRAGDKGWQDRWPGHTHKHQHAGQAGLASGQPCCGSSLAVGRRERSAPVARAPASVGQAWLAKWASVRTLRRAGSEPTASHKATVRQSACRAVLQPTPTAPNPRPAPSKGVVAPAKASAWSATKAVPPVWGALKGRSAARTEVSASRAAVPRGAAGKPAHCAAPASLTTAVSALSEPRRTVRPRQPAQRSVRAPDGHRQSGRPPAPRLGPPKPGPPPPRR